MGGRWPPSAASTPCFTGPNPGQEVRGPPMSHMEQCVVVHFGLVQCGAVQWVQSSAVQGVGCGMLWAE